MIDSAIASGTANVSQQSSETKKAFDSSQVSFKTFNSVDLNLQYTIFLGEQKTFGMNAALSYSNSKYYSIRDRLDIFVGPVLAIPNSEKEASKLNFGLMLGFKNVFDSELSTKDKFTVAFNVNIPLKVVSL